MRRVDADHHPGRGYACRGACHDGDALAAHPGEPDNGDHATRGGTLHDLQGSLDAVVFLLFLSKLIEGASRKIR
jgi:hypothetical protein